MTTQMRGGWLVFFLTQVCISAMSIVHFQPIVHVTALFQLNNLNNEQQKMLSKAIKSTTTTFDVHFFDPFSLFVFVGIPLNEYTNNVQLNWNYNENEYENERKENINAQEEI